MKIDMERAERRRCIANRSTDSANKRVLGNLRSWFLMLIGDIEERNKGRHHMIDDK